MSSNEILPAHSRIGASSMHRWAVCPGSVKLSVGVPESTSKYAEEGTRAHTVASTLLEAFRDKVAPRHREFASEEMMEAVETYVDHCLSIFTNLYTNHKNQMLIEHKFNLSHLHPGLFGTGDCVIYDASDKILHVIDYKHGAGIPVEAKDNEQLMYYGLGALLSLNLPVKKVILTIVQPRCFHPAGPIRSCEVGPSELVDFTADLIEFAKRTEDPNAPLVAGDHCRFCPAAFKCPEIGRVRDQAAAMDFSPAPIIAYTPGQIGKALAMIPVLEAFISNVKEMAYAEALKGNVPIGYKLVNGKSSRSWKESVNIEESLVFEFGLKPEDLYTKKLLSPAQVEKLLKKGEKAELAKLIDKSPGGLTLAPESDARQPSLSAPESEFTIV